MRFSSCILILLVMGSASVRADPFYAATGTPHSPGPMRVQTNFQFVTSLPAGTAASDQTLAVEAARKTLYEIASRECDLLKAAFKGSCRLMTLNVNSSLQDRSGSSDRGGAVSFSAGGMATYEVGQGSSEPQQP